MKAVAVYLKLKLKDFKFVKFPPEIMPCAVGVLDLIHTMRDKFEKATLRAKTEQMFCVHT